jgi:hypothetical protein
MTEKIGFEIASSIAFRNYPNRQGAIPPPPEGERGN